MLQFHAIQEETDTWKKSKVEKNPRGDYKKKLDYFVMKHNGIKNQYVRGKGRRKGKAEFADQSLYAVCCTALVKQFKSHLVFNAKPENIRKRSADWKKE